MPFNMLITMAACRAGPRRSLRSADCGRKRWLLWLYTSLPPFAFAAEAIYRMIAANRTPITAASRVWRGRSLRPPTYHIASALFLRLLGVVYLIAFVSLWTQIDGLIGDHGILPASELSRRGPAALRAAGSAGVARLESAHAGVDQSARRVSRTLLVRGRHAALAPVDRRACCRCRRSVLLWLVLSVAVSRRAGCS